MSDTDNIIDEKLIALTNLSQGDFEAFLYDCDGTLADNMGAHRETYVHLAARDGVAIDGDMIDELAGWPVVDVVKEINKRYNADLDPVAFAAERQQLFFDEYIEKTLPIEHVVNHLKAHAGQVKIGVVSGGQRVSVEKTLNILGIRNLVEVMVCANETPNGKPFPDPFLAAAEKLGVKPSRCLVFEDGDPGVQSAEAAGMKWIRIDKL
ncbi:HAD family hydrolase [Mucilaginibacter limnophilus]|uniref:HAD family hydrolase n=1 Tax=Mucilaginibacter limnophilus TaxID=1932778 RepID=A0A437MZD2_9SPHI|nr:HAD-IA family hydrolase [Mucilaginibacter limnophilus]RVU03033.1 HAD family hydrolase [Mucilaginibacter limnophilus]